MGAYMNCSTTSKIAIKMYSQKKEELRRKNLRQNDIPNECKFEYENHNLKQYKNSFFACNQAVYNASSSNKYSSLINKNILQ